MTYHYLTSHVDMNAPILKGAMAQTVGMNHPDRTALISGAAPWPRRTTCDICNSIRGAFILCLHSFARLAAEAMCQHGLCHDSIADAKLFHRPMGPVQLEAKK